MKTIPVKNAADAMVDDEDYERLSQWKWYSYSGYPRRRKKLPREPQKMIGMHREIMDPPAGMEVDHINGNPLDNRRANLRICTHAQNAKNRSKTRTRITSSPFRGVSWCKERNGWLAQISRVEKRINLGVYQNERDAAIAYDRAALVEYGEFAKPNFCHATAER